MAKVVITPRSLANPGHPALEALRKAGHELIIPAPGKTPTLEDLKPHLPAAAGWLAGVEPITAEMLALAGNLRIIARNGAGMDNVDLVAARERGIEVTNTPGANAQSVAELALALMLTLARSIPLTNASIKAGGWDRMQGVELQGKTLGVAGCGQIGKKLAKMALGMEMRVIGYDLYPDLSFKPEGFSFVDEKRLLAEADFLSLHLPAGDKPFLDAQALATMKKGAYIINAARAGVVDSDALLAGLNTGGLSGYAVDAFNPEPPGATPLTTHPRVVCTAHIGAFTKESVLRSAEQAAEKIVAALA